MQYHVVVDHVAFDVIHSQVRYNIFLVIFFEDTKYTVVYLYVQFICDQFTYFIYVPKHLVILIE